MEAAAGHQELSCDKVTVITNH